jgi:hypothetical protein
MKTLSKRVPIATPMKSPDEKSVTDSVNSGWRCNDHCQILPKARKDKPITINASAFFDLISTGKSPKLQINAAEKRGDDFDA